MKKKEWVDSETGSTGSKRKVPILEEESASPSPKPLSVPKRKRSLPAPKKTTELPDIIKTNPVIESESPKNLMEDKETLVTINARLRDQVAQLQTELEHAQRVLQINVGSSPLIPNRCCQTETENLILHYDNIVRVFQGQLAKMHPSHPKFWWYECAHHLNVEANRLIRDSFKYRGFIV